MLGRRYHPRVVAPTLIERYAALLPVTPRTPRITLGEGGTPLVRASWLERECGIERWGRPGASASAWFEEQSRALGDSFARGRPGSAAAYFGPCQAVSPDVARELLEWFLDLHPGEAIYWDLFPDNTPAIDLARGHGFAPLRKLVRMARRSRSAAPPMPTDIDHTYAIAGFEWG